MSRLKDYIFACDHRLAMPIGVNAGLEMADISVRQSVSEPAKQYQAVRTLHERFDTLFALTAMDLSAEAEAFGCHICMEEHEVPTVIGRLVTDRDEVERLEIPAVGSGRTQVHIETAARLVDLPGKPLVLGGVIGPFSLAGRLFGVSEALELSMTDAELLLALLEKATAFITAYVGEFKKAGAAGVIMAEPAAGLLSPRALSRFSSNFVRQICQVVEDEQFSVILHNCGARLVHLNAILESGAELLHFGALMDMTAARAQLPDEVILCGNLDPTEVFYEGTPQLVKARTTELLASLGGQPNFVLSSGCDLPPGVPLENLTAFFAALNQFNRCAST